MNRDMEAGAAVPVSSTKTYIIIWAVLLGLTIIAVTVTRRIEGSFGVAVPFVVASVKAVLVFLYFMHLKDERGVFRVIFWVVIFTLVVLFAFLFSDVGYR